MHTIHQTDAEGNRLHTYFLTRLKNNPRKVGVLITDIDITSITVFIPDPQRQPGSALDIPLTGSLDSARATTAIGTSTAVRTVYPWLGRTPFDHHPAEDAYLTDEAIGFPSAPGEKFKYHAIWWRSGDTNREESRDPLVVPSDAPTELDGSDPEYDWELVEGRLTELDQARYVHNTTTEDTKVTRGGWSWNQLSLGSYNGVHEAWSKEEVETLFPALCTIEETIKDFQPKPRDRDVSLSYRTFPDNPERAGQV
ncbi:hypothetical protein IAT40_001207 [Kwoniella sp. CBS 6097]